MPCFTYGTNDPQYIASYVGQATVELTYAASGTTYSFSQIARLCSIPNKEQIKVWKKATPSSLEVEQVYSDTTFADGYFRIVNDNVILGVAAASGQVIIRRATPNSEMFINFTEGAKLSAEQLNLCFAQLLFIAQEKEFIGSTNNHFYPIANSYTAYSAALSYSLNAYVSYPTTITDSQGNPQTITRIYKCIAPTTPGIPPTNGAYWEPVSYTTNGFVIEGAPLSAPVRFDLSNVEVNHGLIWDGGKFSAGYLGGGTLDSLSDVVINTPLDKQLLQYNNSLQVWQNTTLPLKFGTSNSTLFQGIAYYDSTAAGTITNQSFVVDGSGTPAISEPAGNQLSIFKTNTNNWVIPNPPTVYHILKRIIPNGQDPVDFFADTKNAIDEVAVNLGNPVKVKFFWNLRPGRLNLTSPVGDANLDSVASVFWDRPQELYHFNMYNNIQSNLWLHASETSVTPEVRKVSPYFYSTLTSGSSTEFGSKIHGYGLTSNGFYLSVPECYTSSLARIPIFNTEGSGADDYTFTIGSNLTSDPVGTGRYTELNTGNYLDSYLESIRDMVSAGADKGTFTTLSSGTKKEDWAARYAKGLMFNAVYLFDSDIQYRRLERPTEALKSCLFKIPKNIIYYNKYAMAFAYNLGQGFVGNNGNSTFLDNLNGWQSISKSVRFTGTGLFNSDGIGDSTTLAQPQVGVLGKLLKANEYWDYWCKRWAEDTAGDYNSYFNEADIDWLFKGLTDITTINLNPTLPNIYGSSGVLNYRFPIVESPGVPPENDTYWRNANRYSPWTYRPNLITNEQVGTHLFNIDYNKVFSEAHNFVADPVDEYIFRVVAKSSLVPTFKDVASSSLKTSIICEYGFTDNLDAFSNTPITIGNKLYRKNKCSSESRSSINRLDKTKVHVYIQDEKIESLGGTEFYVITFCVKVPRAKSIGYSRVFRRMKTFAGGLSGTQEFFPEPGGSGQDIDKDSGPWNIPESDGDIPNTTSATTSGDTTSDTSISLTQTETSFITDGGTLDVAVKSDQYRVSGRNECAVKFTRIGIPGDLWIRISVLNTNGTYSLLSGDALSASWNISVT
jgi:hypothetical protein